MAELTYYRCGADHQPPDGMDWPMTAAARMAAALLAEGLCPACPTVRLEVVQRRTFGADLDWGRCSCCEGEWRLDDDGTYTLLPGPGLRVVVDRLLSTADVANRLGVDLRTVSRYASRGDMPAPTSRVGGSPVWATSTIEAWDADRPRHRSR